MTTETALAPVTPEALPPAAPEVVVALSPEELPAAQAHLVEWCDAQMKALQTEIDELEEHRLIAVSNGWKLTSIANNRRRADARWTYFHKIKAALEAGYLIVPNMPVDLLAIRVQRDGPTWATRKRQSSGWKPQRFDVQAEVLPAGEGRYVDEGVPPQSAGYNRTNAKGEREWVDRWRPGPKYVEPDFPIRAVKPAVLSATQRAMALRIFDEIGMVQQDASARGRDPIMVGRIRSGTARDRTARVATFFLAWWLNPADL